MRFDNGSPMTEYDRDEIRLSFPACVVCGERDRPQVTIQGDPVCAGASCSAVVLHEVLCEDAARVEPVEEEKTLPIPVVVDGERYPSWMAWRETPNEVGVVTGALPPDVLAAWERECKCCGECSPVICGGVQQGAFCERICRCEDDGRWQDAPADGDIDADQGGDQ